MRGLSFSVSVSLRWGAESGPGEDEDREGGAAAVGRGGVGVARVRHDDLDAVRIGAQHGGRVAGGSVADDDAQHAALAQPPRNLKHLEGRGCFPTTRDFWGRGRWTLLRLSRAPLFLSLSLSLEQRKRGRTPAVASRGRRDACARLCERLRRSRRWCSRCWPRRPARRRCLARKKTSSRRSGRRAGAACDVPVARSFSTEAHLPARRAACERRLDTHTWKRGP